MPTVSVIIPTFNSQDTLAECIESVICQEFKDYEICIVDGNSSDGTIKIIQDYCKRFNFIKYPSERDKGPYDAMNKGIDMARSEWLYFLGSNDLLHDKWVLKKIFSKTIPKAFGLLYGNVKTINDAGFAKCGEIYDGEFTIEKLLDRNICHQAVIYRRSLFRRLGKYNLRYPVCADWEMNMRFFSNTKVVYLDLTIASFRGGGLSCRRDVRDPIYQDLLYLRKKYFWRYLLVRKISRMIEEVKKIYKVLVPCQKLV